MSLYKITASLCILLFLISCTIYKSPDRKDFEKDFEKKFESTSTNFNVENLQVVYCSDTSAKEASVASRLVSIVKTIPGSPSTDQSVFLWEYRINGTSIFESDNLKGDYCFYENI